MYLSIGETPIKAKDDCPPVVAKRLGDSCTQVGEPGSESGRPEGLPRTAAIKTALRACKSGCIKAQRIAFQSIRSPNPNRHLGDETDYKPQDISAVGEEFRAFCRTRAAEISDLSLAFAGKLNTAQKCSLPSLPMVLSNFLQSMSGTVNSI